MILQGGILASLCPCLNSVFNHTSLDFLSSQEVRITGQKLSLINPSLQLCLYITLKKSDNGKFSIKVFFKSACDGLTPNQTALMPRSNQSAAEQGRPLPEYTGGTFNALHYSSKVWLSSRQAIKCLLNFDNTEVAIQSGCLAHQPWVKAVPHTVY